MKLGFWTSGMPEWSIPELVHRATEYGYQGIDLRCTQPTDGHPPNSGNVSVAESDRSIEHISREFSNAGIEIASLLCYISGGHRAVISDWQAFEADVHRHAGLAEKLGAPRIRVTIGHPQHGTGWDIHLARVWAAISHALDSTPGVGAVIENHPGSANARQLLEQAAQFGDPRVGIQFSPDHTVVMQEDTLQLIDDYAPQIHQVCFADRRPVSSDLARFDGEYYHVRYEPCALGAGIVPAAKIFANLADKGYSGYISLKWEKSNVFGRSLPDGELALASFPEFMASVGVLTHGRSKII